MQDIYLSKSAKKSSDDSKQKSDNSTNDDSSSKPLNDNTNPQPTNQTQTQNTSSDNAQPINNQQPNQYQPYRNPPVRNNWDTGLGGGMGGYGGGWDDPWGESPSTSAPKKRLTPEERISMIEKVYEEVLNRKPDTKDINYYKYSTLEEDEIRKQLLTGKEHKDLIEHGKEYKNIKERCENAEIRVKFLEGQLKDQLEEFKKLGELLREKNRYIQFLRQRDNNPYDQVKK